MAMPRRFCALVFMMTVPFFLQFSFSSTSQAGIIGTWSDPNYGGSHPIFFGGECSLCDARDACGVEYTRQIAIGNGNIWLRCYSGGLGEFQIPGVNKWAPALRSPASGGLPLSAYKFWLYFIATGERGCADIPGCTPLNEGKDLGPRCNAGPSSGMHVGNPCNPATGNKYQAEYDYQSFNGTRFIARHYNSRLGKDLGLGFGWTSFLSKQLTITGTLIFVHRPDGRRESFVKSLGTWKGDVDTRLTLTEDVTGYVLTFPNGAVERYHLNGRVVSETDSAGRTTTYAYRSDGKLDHVTDPFGHTLTVSYDT